MTRRLTYVLVADGSSDRALLRIVDWTLISAAPHIDPGEPGFVARGGRSLDRTMRDAVDQYQPDLLFVHRDAERFDLATRRREIPHTGHPLVRVVPVRMTEAWLLIDENAIRQAAGNPNGREPLALPATSSLEELPDPKSVLRRLLVAACGHAGPRRLGHFERTVPERVVRLADHISDFAPLRRLPSFTAFEADVRAALAALPWRERSS